jgi:hypothetical protein
MVSCDTFGEVLLEHGFVRVSSIACDTRGEVLLEHGFV